MKCILSIIAAAGVVIAASLAPAMANPGDQQIVNVVNAAKGWTSVVPLGLPGDDGHTDLLSYNAATGLAVYTVGIDTKGDQQVVNVVQAAKGWTSIVPVLFRDGGYADLLSYNAHTGEAVYSIAIDSQGDQRVVSVVQAGKGWTSIVPVNLTGFEPRYTDLLWYNAKIGRALFSRATGRLDMPYQVVKDYQAAKGWTSIVPLSMPNDQGFSDFLSYNKNTGLAIYSIVTDDQGDQQVVSIVHAARGWTAIVPMYFSDLDWETAHTDLLWYNAKTGHAIASVADSSVPGIQHITKDYTAATGWSAIVPMSINDDLLTDLLSYNASTGLAIYSIGRP